MSCVRHLSERLDRHEAIEVRLALGRVCLAMGELDNARDHFERARQAFPELAQPWAQLGVIATHAGQHRSALRFFEHALERDPDDLISRTNLAEACRKSRLADRAETEYRRVLAIAHGNVEARVGLAELYLARGEESGDPDAYHEAITYLAQALDYGALGRGLEVAQARRGGDPERERTRFDPLLPRLCQGQAVRGFGSARQPLAVERGAPGLQGVSPSGPWTAQGRTRDPAPGRAHGPIPDRCARKPVRTAAGGRTGADRVRLQPDQLLLRLARLST